LGKKYLEIPTDKGMINLEVLNDYIESHDIKSMYITSLIAYTATHPGDKIYDLCNLHDVVLILDISGTVGCEKINTHCDVQIASTGSPKIVNCENGGFINNITKKITFNNHLLKSFKADKITCAAIAHEIRKSPEILKKTIETNTYLKKNLSKKLMDDTHKIVYENSAGINTIITTESKKKAKDLAYRIKQELKIADNKSIITTGPNYNRLKIPSVNIEVKNIDVDYLTEENMDYLTEIIVEKIYDD
jgi:selenocysteine lyase/cysteine desulfurase